MNHTEMALELAAKIAASWTAQGAAQGAKATQSAEPNRLDITVEAADLLPAVAALNRAHWGYLAAITGLDLGPAGGRIELLYHFCEGAAVLTLRVMIARDAGATVPSLCALIPSAAFFERELEEMLGVVVANAPNHDPLFLPDDWPAGVYPLRKDFTGLNT